MLGVFPLIVMFLITSITMQRERVSGTLERILTTPLRRLDLLAAYGTAFSIAAAAQATLACVVSFWFLGLHTAGSPVWVFVIAIVNAVLGVGLGLLCSAFARTEFQAVQFMPLVIVPQLLLCGIIVPRAALPEWLQWISNVDARQLRSGGAAAGRRTFRADMHRGAGHRDRHRVRGAGAVPGRGDPTAKDTLELTTRSDRKRPGRPPGHIGHPRSNPGKRTRAVRANGIDKTSIRAIAAEAGVDPALVHHYFGTKPSCSPRRSTSRSTRWTIIGPLREVPVEQIGCMLPSLLLPLWDSELGKGFIATLRSMLAGSDVSLIRSFLQDVITVEVGTRVDDPPGSGRIRVQFVASQLVGVVMARYILELEPFKSLPVQQIVDTVAPNLQRYLTGELPRSTTVCAIKPLMLVVVDSRRPHRSAAPGCRRRSGTCAAAAGCRERRPTRSSGPRSAGQTRIAAASRRARSCSAAGHRERSPSSGRCRHRCGCTPGPEPDPPGLFGSYWLMPTE